MIKIQELRKSTLKEISAAGDLEKLEKIRIKYLGRKGELTLILRSLKDLPLEERRKIGPLAQQLKKELEELSNKKAKELTAKSLKLKAEIDITRPGKKIKTGHLHPLSKIEEEIRNIFLSMNFSVVEGPEIEDEYHNFDALNIPKDHPARDAWNTFWLKETSDKRQGISDKRHGIRDLSHIAGRLLLRTHTSPMQIRYMETHNPPFQIIVPGRVFRYEATDASHEINFYQIEGLMIGGDVSLANFKFIIEEFFKKFFGREIEFRYRPSYFPFVEPGVEVDIKFKNKWLEIMGAGMVHRKVFESVKYNPYEWQGFAFGMSLERLTMIKYNIDDIRLFYSGDLRFINQF
jgi:phenylalanyl-tRNA synthetase alpha chain